MVAIFFAIVGLIIYGSLYPWTFRLPTGPDDPVAALVQSWFITPVFDRRYLADVLINLALYMPIGMSGYLAFRNVNSEKLRIAGLVVFGFVLSASIEMLQLFVPGRRCSAIDLLNNTLGTASGVIPGMLFEAIVGRKWIEGLRRRRVDRPALAILLIWLGSLLFPLFPVLWLGVFRQKLAVMGHAPVFNLVPFLSAVGSWYVAGLLLKNVVSARFLLWASVALIPAQFFVMSRVPSLPELLGAMVGVALFDYLGKKSVAWAFLGLIVFRGLAPFRFGAPHTLSMIPFGGFLDMEWQAGIRLLLEKFWYFGAAIWVLRSERMPLNRAIVIVTLTAAALEGIQVYAPGRTAEITDPLLALLVGFAIRALRRNQTASASPARVS